MPSGKPDNLTGRRFGRLLVIRRDFEWCGSGVRWECLCDCGSRHFATAGHLRSGNISSCPCRKRMKGRTYYYWKGGRHTTPKGYVRIRVDGKYRMEHDVLMEQYLKRPLAPGETVHHKNGVRNDNRTDNLELRVGAHRQGLSVEEVVAWAKEILMRYERGCNGTA